MVCVGLPIQSAVRREASADSIVVYDEHGRPYNLSNLLACGRKMYFGVHVTWRNCHVIRVIITCGNGGTARRIIEAYVKLPSLNGTGWFIIKAQGGVLFDVTRILERCGYSCTSKQAVFCAQVNPSG